ncbi:MAG: fumarylacetoacetate hydrolase family protein [Pseudomonadota bacterium]
MSIDPDNAATQVAQALVRARRGQRTIAAADCAFVLRDAADAYEAQALAAQLMPELLPGHPQVWKSGGPSRSATLTHAPLPAAGILPSPADASRMHFNSRWIEAEIALRLAADGSPRAMAVSIEIVDSRWTESMQAPPLAKLADLQSHGALVLGEWIAFEPREWSSQRCEVSIGGEKHEFTGTHSLGDPAWLLPAWLAHAKRHGLDTVSGAIVTTGTWCGMLPARASDSIHVRFPGIGEASVRL